MSRAEIRAMFIDEAPTSIYIAIAHSSNSATLVEFDSDKIIDSITAVAMALDQINFDTEPKQIVSLGTQNPVLVDVPNVGKFSLYYLNDWGNYAVTHITGPRYWIGKYNQLAANDGFDLRGTKRSG